MKKVLLYWLMGDRAGRTLTATWNWLWGVPLEHHPQIAKEVAQESLQSMQNSVTQLMNSVATVMTAHQQAKAIYDRKHKEFRQAEEQALLAHQHGEEETAHLAMGRAIQIESLLPQLQERVTQAQRLAEQMQQKLKLERQKLEHYKGEMQNLEALAQVNQALAAIAKTSGDLDMGTAKTQFDQANQVIQHQYFKGSARAELSQNPTDALQANLDRLTLDEQISRRLQRTVTPQQNSPKTPERN
jgi:phage shock protein A